MKTWLKIVKAREDRKCWIGHESDSPHTIKKGDDVYLAYLDKTRTLCKNCFEIIEEENTNLVEQG